MKVKCSVTIDSDIVEQVESVAKAQRTTFSALVNVALAERFLADQSRSELPKEANYGN